MYTIFSDGSPIYSPNLIQFGYSIISGKITQELNKAGSLDFTIPKTNPMYSRISKLKSIITVEEDGEEIWRGRILDDTKDFYNNKKILCEGELAFLNDVYIPNYDFSNGISIKDYFDFLISFYSSNCSSYRRIEPGTVYFSNSEMIKIKLEDNSDVLTELNTNLVDKFGGYLIFRRENGVSYLDYYEKLEKILDQPIIFGKNLISFEEYINAADVYTYLIPLGKKNEDGVRVDISSVNEGKNYIFSDKAEELFGKIWKTSIWDEIESPSVLLSNAQKEMESGIQMAASITINAVDLHQLGVDVSRIKIGYQVPVISVPHEVNSNFLCSKLTLDLSDPGQNEYGLGLAFSALTNEMAKTSKKAKSAYSISVVYSDSSSKISSDLKTYKTQTNETLLNLENRVKALEEAKK